MVGQKVASKIKYRNFNSTGCAVNRYRWRWTFQWIIKADTLNVLTSDVISGQVIIDRHPLHYNLQWYIWRYNVQRYCWQMLLMCRLKIPLLSNVHGFLSTDGVDGWSKSCIKNKVQEFYINRMYHWYLTSDVRQRHAVPMASTSGYTSAVLLTGTCDTITITGTAQRSSCAGTSQLPCWNVWHYCHQSCDRSWWLACWYQAWLYQRWFCLRLQYYLNRYLRCQLIPAVDVPDGGLCAVGSCCSRWTERYDWLRQWIHWWLVLRICCQTWICWMLLQCVAVTVESYADVQMKVGTGCRQRMWWRWDVQMLLWWLTVHQGS